MALNDARNDIAPDTLEHGARSLIKHAIRFVFVEDIVIYLGVGHCWRPFCDGACAPGPYTDTKYTDYCMSIAGFQEAFQQI